MSLYIKMHGQVLAPIEGYTFKEPRKVSEYATFPDFIHILDLRPNFPLSTPISYPSHFCLISSSTHPHFLLISTIQTWDLSQTLSVQNFISLRKTLLRYTLFSCKFFFLLSYGQESPGWIFLYKLGTFFVVENIQRPQFI